MLQVQEGEGGTFHCEVVFATGGAKGDSLGSDQIQQTSFSVMGLYEDLPSSTFLTPGENQLALCFLYASSALCNMHNHQCNIHQCNASCSWLVGGWA